MAIDNTQGIVVENVDKTYYPSPPWMKALVRSNITSPVTALRDVNFTVDPGEIVAMVGPNGAGKTTTFRIIVGLTTPTAGSAYVKGLNATTESTAVRSLVGWMPGDDRSLLMRLTCTENLRFHGRLQGMHGKRLERRITDTLEAVDLGHAAQKTIFALSAGMRARMQLARALLHEPPVLVLDEPTGTIDPVAAHGLLELIKSIVKDQGIATILSSHRLEEIESLQSRVILLDRGMIRYDGDLETLRARLDRPCLLIRFATDDAAARAAKTIVAAGLAATVDMEEDGRVRLILEHGTAAGSVLNELDGLLPDVVQVTDVKRPLRDVLADFYGAYTTEPERSRDRSDDRSRRRKREKRQRHGRRR